MLKPGLTIIFVQYHKEVFMPYLLTQLTAIQRIDIIQNEHITFLNNLPETNEVMVTYR